MEKRHEGLFKCLLFEVRCCGDLMGVGEGLELGGRLKGLESVTFEMGDEGLGGRFRRGS